MSSEYTHGEPLTDPPSAKYRRATITLQLGVPETWMEDGSEARIIAAIETLFGTTTTGTGPGGAIMHGLFALSWKPGEVAKLPNGASMESVLERWRLEYPLRSRPLRSEPRDDSLRAPDGAPWYAHNDGPCGPDCSERKTWAPRPGQMKLTLYPEAPSYAAHADMHEPPPYPAESLDWQGEPTGYPPEPEGELSDIARYADRCPTCSSRMPQLHPSAGEGGEVTTKCPDVWHGTPHSYFTEEQLRGERPV